MINISRRKFLNKCFNYGTIFSLSVVVGNVTFNASDIKFISEKFYLMGTYGKIQVFIKDVDYGTFAIKSAINKIKDIELLLTKFSPESEIGIINNNPYLYNLVSNDTLFVLSCGNEISAMTDGYFDMGMGNFLSISGIDNTVPPVGKCISKMDFMNNLILINKNKVKLNRKNSMLDLGGIGKGYALDEAMKIFTGLGVKNVAIEFGGDVKVNGGMPFDKPWTISFNNAISSSYKYNIKPIKLFSGSLAISGGYLKRSNLNKIDVKHHIINPKTLSSQNYYSLVLVSGKDALICDALSTSCYNMSFSLLDKMRKNFINYNIETYV